MADCPGRLPWNGMMRLEQVISFHYPDLDTGPPLFITRWSTQFALEEKVSDHLTPSQQEQEVQPHGSWLYTCQMDTALMVASFAQS